MEIMPDHVHLFLNVKPTDELLKIPTLWTPSYFVSTAGNVCTETVMKYIEQQRD